MHPSPPTVAKPTLAEKLSTTCHVSPLLQELNRHGLTHPKGNVVAAIDRGCWHFAGMAALEGTTQSTFRFAPKRQTCKIDPATNA